MKNYQVQIDDHEGQMTEEDLAFVRSVVATMNGSFTYGDLKITAENWKRAVIREIE